MVAGRAGLQPLPRKKFRNPRLVRPSPPEYIDPELIDLWHNGCAHAESIWEQYPEVEDDHSLRKELLYSSRTQLFVTTTTSTPDGAAPISAAAASTPMSSPPPKYRSSTPLVSELKTQLRNVCAARIAALARGRAARKVARDARSLLLARRFRATPLRSIAAVDIARVARSYLARRHFRRGGDRAAAAAAAADDDDIIVRATTTTSAPPPTPSSRRGNRGSRTPTLAGDCYDGKSATTASRTTTTTSRASLLLELPLSHIRNMLMKLTEPTSPTSRARS